MNFNYKMVEPIERQLILEVLNGEYSKPMTMLAYFIHQHDKSSDILTYMIKNDIKGKKILQVLANDFNFDYDKFINYVLMVSKNKVTISN